MGRSVSLKNIRDQQHLFPVLTRRQLSQHLSDTHGCCIPKTIVRGRCHYYYHFADEDTEAQRGRVICPRLHSFRVARLGLEPQQLTYTALTLKPAEGNSPARPRSLLGRQRRRSPWPAPLSAAMEGAWRAGHATLTARASHLPGSTGSPSPSRLHTPLGTRGVQLVIRARARVAGVYGSEEQSPLPN